MEGGDRGGAQPPVFNAPAGVPTAPLVCAPVPVPTLPRVWTGHIVYRCSETSFTPGLTRMVANRTSSPFRQCLFWRRSGASNQTAIVKHRATRPGGCRQPPFVCSAATEAQATEAGAMFPGSTSLREKGIRHLHRSRSLPINFQGAATGTALPKREMGIFDQTILHLYTAAPSRFGLAENPPSTHLVPRRVMGPHAFEARVAAVIHTGSKFATGKQRGTTCPIPSVNSLRPK
jgi:hypothetical protein